ncbi:MAG: hypothetical protein ACOC5T_00855 [Elusimicrobiota bacterium]
MQYQCKLANIDKMPLDSLKSRISLCDTCKTEDCTNPIQKRLISILGIAEEHRLYIVNDDPYLVVECYEGYSK